jgi:hypothetical protein
MPFLINEIPCAFHNSHGNEKASCPSLNIGRRLRVPPSSLPDVGWRRAKMATEGPVEIR